MLLHPLNFDYVFLHYLKNKWNKRYDPWGDIHCPIHVTGCRQRCVLRNHPSPSSFRSGMAEKTSSLWGWGEREKESVSGVSGCKLSLYAGFKVNWGMQEFSGRVESITSHYNLPLLEIECIWNPFFYGDWLSCSNTASYSYLSQRMGSPQKLFVHRVLGWD